MRMPEYSKLPKELQCDEVKHYYDILKTKSSALMVKRIFDVIIAVIFIILMSFPIAVIAILIK